MRLPEFSVKRPVTVLMLILIIVVLGLISLSHLGLDMMPDINYPAMFVVTRYEDVAPEEIESLVTKPIEEAVATVKGIKNVKSFSQEGFSAVLAEFEWGRDLDGAAQDIRDRVEMTKMFLPRDIENPHVIKFDPSMMPIMAYGITGQRSPRSLRKLAEDVLKDRLEQIDGVASVLIWGGREREILVEVSRSKLRAHNLSLNQVVSRLKSGNINLPGGRIEKGYKEYSIRTVGEFATLEDIESLVVAVKNGAPVYLKDIAVVLDTYKEIRDYARTNKRDSILVLISKESGTNTVRVSDRIEKELVKIKKELPPDIRLAVIFDQSTLIKRILKVTGNNAVWGGILAVCVLFFFLRSWRPTVIVTLAIPFSIIAVFIPLYFLGHTLNFTTMLGIALGVGLIVDNSIVVIENSFRHLGRGTGPGEAAALGASEVGMAITTSTLTTVAVFLPLVFASGLISLLFEGLATSVVSALFASLLIALTIVPMVSSRILKAGGSAGYQAMFGKRTFDHYRERYKKALGWALQARGRVILWTLGIFFASLLLLPLMAKEFFPVIDNNMAMMKIKLPEGTNLRETDRVTRIGEDIVSGEEGLENIGAFVGLARGGEMDAAFGTGPAGVHESQIFIRLKEKLKRKRVSSRIVDSIRRRSPKMEGVKYEFMDMGRSMMTGGGSAEMPINLKIFGKDMNVLKKLSGAIVSRMEKVKGIYDVSSSITSGKPEFQIEIDRRKASQMGLTVGQIASEVEDAMIGKVATRFRTGGDEIDVRVRMRKQDRETLDDLKKIGTPRTAANFGRVRLSQVAGIRPGFGPIRLTRENQKRTVYINANLSGKDLGRALKDVKKQVKKISFPEGYFVEYGGEAEKMQETFISLGEMLLLAVLLIFMIMAAQFESLVQPFVIIFTVPFAIIGVIWVLFLTGKSLSLPTGMGILILTGIIVNNAIVMVDYINQLRRSGMEKTKAIIEAASTRLRPILMTTTTTVLAMVPLAVSRAEGSEARSVATTSIIGGLVAGTMLTLIVIPTLYSLFQKDKK